MWPFGRCAFSLLPRPPRAAHPYPIPHYPAPRFPTIPRAAKSLALVSPASTARSAGRPTRHSSRRRCAAHRRRPFCAMISTRTWFRCMMAAQLSGKALGGPQASWSEYTCGGSGFARSRSRRAHPARRPRHHTPLPRAALPHHTPRGLQAGAGVTSIYRRWCGPPNPPLKLTPLCGPKAAAILHDDLDTRVVPRYHGGAA